MSSTEHQQQHQQQNAQQQRHINSSVPVAPPTPGAIPTVRGTIFPTNDSVVRRDIISVTACTNTTPEQWIELRYTNVRVVGNGSFGVVYVARHFETGEQVAIKKVLQDRRYKNRELQIMRQLDHPNVVKLKYFFYLHHDTRDDVYLSLILEFVPDTIYRVARQYAKQRTPMPHIYVRLYTYQLFRALGYIHSLGVCHRDIKPQNLLVDPQSGVLKLCDFGSAKFLVPNEPNVSYICSRYYRAPELIFGSTNYTNSIDVWSAGTVLAELIHGQPIFPGESGVDQLVEIIKIIGTPSREQIQQMNPNYTQFRFPQIRAQSWSRIFRQQTPPEALDLVSKLLEYNPASRLTPAQVCNHDYFNELRAESTKLPNGQPLPPLVNENGEFISAVKSTTGGEELPGPSSDTGAINNGENSSEKKGSVGELKDLVAKTPPPSLMLPLSSEIQTQSTQSSEKEDEASMPEKVRRAKD